MATLTVATLNLYGPPFRQDERASLVVDQLVDLGPDIIGLQEVDLSADLGNRVCQRANGQRPADAPYRIYHVANPGRDVSRGGVATMTRLPALFHEGLDYLIQELEWNRIAHRIRVEAGGAALDFYNTHFHYLLGPEADTIRCEQARKLLAWMDSHGWEVPKVLVGDFNAWPDSEPIRLLKERFTSAFEAMHRREPEKTWPTPMVKQANAPDWTLDYIFVSPGVKVRGSELAFTKPAPSDPGLYPSDHFGLTAVIEFG